MVLLILDSFKLSEEKREYLKDLGYRIIGEKNEDGFADVEVIVGYRPFDTYSYDQFPNLKLIHLQSAGFDTMEPESVGNRGIRMCNASGIYSIPIAEFVIARLLSVYKKLDEFDQLQHDKVFEKILTLEELTNKKALILGTGSIATEIAKRLNAFDSVVDGISRRGLNSGEFNQCFKLDELNGIIGNYEIIINSLPLNDDSYHVLNRSNLSLCDDQTILVNIGRGPTIHEQELIELLDTHFRTVILDVFEEEPLPKDSVLWTHPKVLVSAHSSFPSQYSASRLSALIVKNLTAWIKQEPLENVVV